MEEVIRVAVLKGSELNLADQTVVGIPKRQLTLQRIDQFGRFCAFLSQLGFEFADGLETAFGALCRGLFQSSVFAAFGIIRYLKLIQLKLKINNLSIIQTIPLLRVLQGHFREVY